MTQTKEPTLSPADYIPDLSLLGRINRRRVFLSKAAPMSTPRRSVITFSFDDFPISAADTGADILDKFDAKGIYYACSGLAGGTNLTGEQYHDTHLLALDRAGHEIGAHTHTHLDCAQASSDTALADIDRNLGRLRTMGLQAPIEHFAYPYGETTLGLKKRLISKFTTARGILPAQNNRGSDRMQLGAYELTPDDATTQRALNAIEAATRKPAWIHIFTHDVRPDPSPFGTTPAALTSLVRHARDTGLLIAPPRDAMAKLESTANG